MPLICDMGQDGFYFSSEGRRAEDFFFPEKSVRLRPGLNPRTWVPKGSTSLVAIVASNISTNTRIS
jgi:hypothetical protein